ncbi:MAG TPA: hypothetical protein VJA19_03790 [Pseudomonas sp.]|nr:hypothetical protein [Pseudomonas sp.]
MKKISALPAATEPLAGTEQFEVVQVGVSKRIAKSVLFAVTDAAITALNAAIAGLGSFAAANYAEAPFPNLMPDSGRFAGKMNPLALGASGAFTASAFFSAYNGSSIGSAGKFVHDNSSNGGAGAALTATVSALLAAMGRVGSTARYGIEFYVARIVAGAGGLVPNVGADAVTRYLLSTNGSRAIFGASGYTTVSLWLRVATGSVHCSSPIFVNDVLQPAGYVFPANQFVHARLVRYSAVGYDTAVPNLFSTVGAEVDIALPCVFSGVVNTGIHTAPLPTINELSA